jgi:tetratricopeptide (TPR) repeat protein
MYNIYHLMRRRGGEANRVRAVVDFMVHMYDEEGLVDVTRAIVDEACRVDPETRKDHFAAFRSILEHTASPDARASLWSSIDPKFFHLEDTPSDIKNLLRGKGYVEVRETPEKYGSSSGAADEHPENWDTSRWFIAIENNKMSFEDMERAARKALEVNPKRQRVWLNLGFSLFCMKRFEEAESAFRQAIAADRNSPSSYGALGYLLEVLGRDAEAVEAYEKSLKCGRPIAHNAILLGHIRYKQKNYLAAEKAYRKALGIDPSIAEAWNGRGDALKQLGKYSEGEKVLRQAIELKVGDVRSWSIFGTILFNQEKIKEAKQALYEAIKLYKGGQEVSRLHGKLAVLLIAEGAFEEALQEACLALADEDFIRESPQMPIPSFVLFAGMGHAAEALAVLKSSPSKRYLEPLLVALQMIVGEEHNAPQEVVEVASDIVKQVEKLKPQAQSAPAKKSSERPRAAKRPKASPTKPRRKS